MNISSRHAYSLSLFIVIIGAQLFQRLAAGMLARQCGTLRFYWNDISEHLTLLTAQGGTLLLQRSLGPVALLVANAMSMLVRIAFTGAYIRRRFLRLKTNTRINLPSKTYFMVSSKHACTDRNEHLIVFLRRFWLFSPLFRECHLRSYVGIRTL